MTARIVLGVAGGIAAYKACELLRRFTEAGHTVRVVPTEGALRFVGAPTWAALSGQPVATDVWTDADQVPHVRLGREADLVVVAPATADLLARAATGRADDLLTATLLTARGPQLFAPAMHTEMWEHPATAANVATLRARGAVVLDPAVGRLTGPDSGRGRLPEPAAIQAVADRLLARGRNAGDASTAGTGAGWRPDLAGRRVLITAGGTREHLDPVRFLGNNSSGRQGYALATAALARGARVTVVAANVALPDPAGAEMIRVGSTDQLRTAVLEHLGGVDAVVMAAAPADFAPVTYHEHKIKKTSADPDPIRLRRTPDVAAAVGERKAADQLLVIFAAETDDLLANARRKLAAKHADLVVANDVAGGAVFGASDNAATVLGADGSSTEIPRTGKTELADAIWDLVVARLSAGPAGRDGHGPAPRIG